MRLGFFLSCEEYPPDRLLTQAESAARAGFQGFWISDHFHPWLDEQGHSPFVWSMIGALSRVSDLPVTTAVTCPIMRIDPVMVAQAAATCGALTGGRFTLGVGTGEALNESITGRAWPPAAVRLEMLEEAIDLMRELWTGDVVNHRGRHFTAQHARLYTLPPEPPKIYISATGPKSIRLAAEKGDGYISTKPNGELVAKFREGGGNGKVAQGGMKACFDRDEATAMRVAHERWRSSGLPGELSQILPTPEHFEQASTLVTPEKMKGQMVLGANPEDHLKFVSEYREAGFDELYVAPVGPNDLDMIEFYRSEILPAIQS